MALESDTLYWGFTFYKQSWWLMIHRYQGNEDVCKMSSEISVQFSETYYLIRFLSSIEDQQGLLLYTNLLKTME